MVKENLYDNTLRGITDFVEAVSDSIAKEFKGANPFDQQPMTNDEITAQFNTLSLEEKVRLLNQTGGK